MFGTIRKHQTWLWAIIITLTIISFVIFFSPYQRMSGSGRGTGNFGSINGERISEEQLVNAQREMYLRYFFLSGGRFPDADAKKNGFDLERETYQWLLLIQQQERLGIHSDSAAVAEYARQLVLPFQRMGVTSPTVLVQQVLQPKGFGMEDFERFVRHSLGLQELVATVGLSGKLVTPQQAKDLYVRERQEVETQGAFFNASNYLASVTATPEAISQFYSNQLANYRVPERVQVSYVKFSVSNYLGQAQKELTNLTELVEMNMRQLGTNYVRFGKTPEEAQAKIREEVLQKHAMADARIAAADFARPLLEAETMHAQDLEKLAKEKGLTVQVTEPFDREEGPKNLAVGPEFVQRSFSRTADEPFAGPVDGTEAVYVLALDKKTPSYIPPLGQIRDRVTADYKHVQAVMKARTATMAFDQTVTNALAQGKSFAAICTEAKVQPVNLSPFSLSTRYVPETEDRVNLDMLKRAAFGTQPGHATTLPTQDGGMVLFVKAKLPVDQAKLQADMPSFMRMVRQRSQEEAFSQWFSKEAQRGLRDTPLNRPQTPPPAMRSGAPAKS